MKSKKTIVRELKSLVGLMRLGLLLAAMVLTAGCGGGGDDPDSSGSGSSNPGGDSTTPIVFSALQQDEQNITRAGQDSRAGTRVSTPLEDLQILSFDVWGFKNTTYTEGVYGGLQTVIPRYHVVYEENSANTTTSNSDGWEYVNKQTGHEPEQTIKYWDWSANAYRFFGLTHGEGITVTSGQDAYQVAIAHANANDQDECPYYSHLWFSTGNPSLKHKPFGKPVQIEFLRPFVSVRFLFVPADPGGTLQDLNITYPQFGPVTAGKNIATKGTFTVIYPLTGTGTSETWEVSDVSEYLTHFTEDASDIPNRIYTQTDNGWYYVLPAKEQGVYRLDLTVNGDPEKGCFVAAEYMDWLPGYSYTYVFKVSEEGGVTLGQVYTAYTDWKTNDNQDVDGTLYNW